MQATPNPSCYSLIYLGEALQKPLDYVHSNIAITNATAYQPEEHVAVRTMKVAFYIFIIAISIPLILLQLTGKAIIHLTTPSKLTSGITNSTPAERPLQAVIRTPPPISHCTQKIANHNIPTVNGTKTQPLKGPHLLSNDTQKK